MLRKRWLSSISPIGLRLEDVEIILENISDKPKHSLEIIYDM